MKLIFKKSTYPNILKGIHTHTHTILLYDFSKVVMYGRPCATCFENLKSNVIKLYRQFKSNT